MNTAEVDQRGRAAGASVRAEVTGWVDIERSLDSVSLHAIEPGRRSRRPLVAAVSCLLIAGVVVLAAVALASDRSTPVGRPSGDVYSFVATGLPEGFRPVEVVRFTQDQDRPIVTYAKFYGDVPSVSIFVSEDSHGLNGRVTHARVHGHPAKVAGFPDGFAGPQYVVRWREAGRVVTVSASGLSRKHLVGIARKIRPATRAEFERSVRGVPSSPYTPDLGPPDPTRGDSNYRVLIEAPIPDGRDKLVLYDRQKADGTRWMCIDAHAPDNSGTGTVCADPAHGFSVPEVNDVSGLRWVIASLQRGQSLRVDLADGTTLNAQTYDTQEGERPILAYIDLGNHETLPQGAVVLEDPQGNVLHRWRFQHNS